MNTAVGIILVIDIDINILEDINIDFTKHILSLEAYTSFCKWIYLVDKVLQCRPGGGRGFKPCTFHIAI